MDADLPLASPCTAVCQLDPGTGFCLGCLRTTEEIAAWPGLDNEGRRVILERLRARRSELGLDRRRETRRRRLGGASSSG
jgi:predicted Fe-S protein YdhL (DUF1289 family)